MTPRAQLLFGMTVASIAIACSDAPTTPLTGGSSKVTDTLLLSSATGSQADTAGRRPDSVSQRAPSTNPRQLVGTVHAEGAAPDTAHAVLIAGAAVVLSNPEDSTAGTAGKELARTTSNADGSFALGAFAPGVYMVTVTPPAGSPFLPQHFGFLVTEFSAPIVDLSVWLPRA
jgi:hypothetical protein